MPLREKAQWLLTKPVIGGGDRMRLERIVARIDRAIEPENPDRLFEDAKTVINGIAHCPPLRFAIVED